MEEIKIIYLPVDALNPYERNAKEHPAEQVEQLKKSIKDYGMNDPIGIWGDSNTIVEGHGQLLACKALGMKEVPCIRLDHMTDEQRREYALVHNQTTMNSGFDFEILSAELADLPSFDAEFFDFTLESENESANPYTGKTKIPQYEVTGECPQISDLFDRAKTGDLLDAIEASEVSDEEKQFLRYAAERHCVFDYGKIAEYYAHASMEMQGLMERSALVIIDIDDAIANGYARLAKKLEELREKDDA